MSAVTDCPLHGKSCNTTDPVHAEGHRNLRRVTKDFYYATLWSQGADPALRRQVEAFLDRIPRRPRPPNPRISL